MTFGGSKDLFSDLPSAKSASLLFGNLPSVKKDESSSLLIAPPTDASNTAQQTTGWDAPSIARTSTSSTVSNSQAPAGMTMPFIPVTLQRKRPAPNHPVNKPSSLNIKLAPSSNTSSSSSHAPKTSTDNTGYIHVHEPSSIVPHDNRTLASDAHDSTISLVLQHGPGQSSQEDTDCHDEFLYVESPQLISLHTQLSEGQVLMYDPHQPNDYLLVLQQRQQQKYKQNLQQQAQEFLVRQVALQKKIDEERRKIDESGDYTAMIASRTHLQTNIGGVGVGRGRGPRSIQNLPAWLIQKQAEQQQEQQEDDKEDKTFKSNNHSCTVVLGNMASLEEVDDELLEEVKEECEAQCGSVLEITVEKHEDHASSSESSSVDIIVTFVDSPFAQQAVRIFQGRTFGKRVITAKIVS